MALTMEGKQIILRNLRLSDSPNIYRYVREREVVRNTLMPRHYTPNSARDFIRFSMRAARRKQPTDYIFGLELSEAKGIIGGLGLHKVNRVHNNLEIGYWLARPFRGRGIMSEAIKLALKFSFRELKVMRVYAPVFAHNLPSSKLLMKCNFTLEGRMRKSHRRGNRYHDSLMYSILREEWLHDGK